MSTKGENNASHQKRARRANNKSKMMATQAHRRASNRSGLPSEVLAPVCGHRARTRRPPAAINLDAARRLTSSSHCAARRRPQNVCRDVAALWTILALACLVQTTLGIGPHRVRVKRALYELPAGAELVLGAELRTSFSCDGLGYGYYADTDNDCKIFHICQSFRMLDGSIYNNHWSFLCGNQTIFNQVSLACTHPEDSVPCESARDFYYVNDYFGDTSSPSVRDADLSAAQELVSRAYGSRLGSRTTAAFS